MTTDEDYESCGLTPNGIKKARKLDEWLDLIVDEATEMFEADPHLDKDPWVVRDFITRCVDAVALSDARLREHWRAKRKKANEERRTRKNGRA